MKYYNRKIYFLISLFSLTFQLICAGQLFGENFLTHKRAGLRLGTGYMINHTEDLYYKGYAQVSGGVLFNSSLLDADIYGITPPSGALLLSATTNIYPVENAGIGCGYMYIRDELATDKETSSGEQSQLGEYRAALLGFMFRSTLGLRVSLYAGLTMSGKIQYKDNNNREYKYDINNYMKFPSLPVILNIEYYFNDNISAMLSYHQNGGEGGIKQKPAGTSPEEKRYMDTKIITFSIGYSLSFN